MVTVQTFAGSHVKARRSGQMNADEIELADRRRLTADVSAHARTQLNQLRGRELVARRHNAPAAERVAGSTTRHLCPSCAAVASSPTGRSRGPDDKSIDGDGQHPHFSPTLWRLGGAKWRVGRPRIGPVERISAPETDRDRESGASCATASCDIARLCRRRRQSSSCSLRGARQKAHTHSPEQQVANS